MPNLLGIILSHRDSVEFLKVFGEVLRDLRMKKGWSQEMLAFEAGADRNYVSLLELGKNSASISMAYKLCTALDIKLSEFFVVVEAHLTKFEDNNNSGQ